MKQKKMRGGWKIETLLRLVGLVLSRLVELAPVLDLDFFSVGSGFLVLERGISEAAKGPRP
jgi:hypothetical protein